MRKGLTTLLTVAIALVGSQAMAIAPTILDIPSPIVGGGTGASQTTKYVYPDAFDLSALAVDDNTTPSLLKWSYEVVGTPKYNINGVAPINSVAVDPTTVPDGSNIMKTLDKTKETKDKDGLPNTVTIRNINMAPYTGTGATQGVGIIDSQVVTFYCSDGAALTSKTVTFYTDNYSWGNNRLSVGTTWKFESADYLTQSWKTVDGPYGDTTTRTMADGRGICFEVQKDGNNMAAMTSRYGAFTLTANKVYRIRATMNGSQTTVNKTPFWDFLIDNYQAAYGKGLNAYGMDAFFMDNEGGANAVLSSEKGTEYTLYWAPAAYRTTQWNDVETDATKPPKGIYSAACNADRDPYLRFRVMDVTSNASLRSEQKFGTLCLQKVWVESIDYTKFVNVGNPLVEIGTVSGVVKNKFKNATNTAPGGNIFVKGLVGTTSIIASTGGTVTLTPGSGAQGTELVTIQPANDLKGIDSNGSIVLTAPYSDILDDYPIAWPSQSKILKMEVDLSAPSTAAEASPWDIIIMSMESATNEVMYESYITATKKLGTPRYTSTPQTYTMFFNTQSETKSSIANFHFLRWRLRFANSSALNWPQPSNTKNTGSVKVSRIAVTEVKVQ